MPRARKSPKRRSPKRKSPVRRKVVKRKSPKRKSPKRKSPKRKSPKRKSPKRKSPKRKSPKRKSPKYKVPKRKNRNIPTMSYKDCVRSAKYVAPAVAPRLGDTQKEFLQFARNKCKDEFFRMSIAQSAIKDGNAKKYNVYYV